MKKIGIIVFVAALMIGTLVAGAFSFGKFTPDFSVFDRSIKGNGNLVSQTRNVESFSKVDVGGVFQVEIIAGDSNEIIVSADENLMEYIRIEADGEQLKISSDKNLRSKNPISIQIKSTRVEAIDASGASKVSIKDIDRERFSVELSGASKLTADGTVSELDIEISGAGKVDTENLDAKKVSVDASGASKASVRATEKLSVDLSGASSLHYSGSPRELIKKTSGASRVSGS